MKQGSIATVAQALTYACPNCQAPANQLCTRPTENSRKPVTWVHSARADAYLGWNQASV